MYKDDYSGLTQGWGNNEADFNNRKDYKTMSNLIFAAYNSLSYQGTGSWLSACLLYTSWDSLLIRP